MAEKKLCRKKAPKMHITSNTKKKWNWRGYEGDGLGGYENQGYFYIPYICICCGGGYAMVNFKEYEKVRTWGWRIFFHFHFFHPLIHHPNNIFSASKKFLLALNCIIFLRSGKKSIMLRQLVVSYTSPFCIVFFRVV